MSVPLLLEAVCFYLYLLNLMKSSKSSFFCVNILKVYCLWTLLPNLRSFKSVTQEIQHPSHNLLAEHWIAVKAEDKKGRRRYTNSDKMSRLWNRI